jgi:hypothetical protein
LNGKEVGDEELGLRIRWSGMLRDEGVTEVGFGVLIAGDEIRWVMLFVLAGMMKGRYTAIVARVFWLRPGEVMLMEW